ncbi:hypothetical protein HMPREF9193_01253 [Treponema lecithinolyticum ATCC 700332]|uniref:Uncharacterized protein n=1 Tax=Treponema lecithinolyticum ATCC 700332 TaxID=1321815 RepID=A0ABN0NYI9_TRELE|nr:hypothetical protein HMPREF9193_01253 [Treponema lecithinolyticum ATCC 700332]
MLSAVKKNEEKEPEVRLDSGTERLNDERTERLQEQSSVHTHKKTHTPPIFFFAISFNILPQRLPKDNYTKQFNTVYRIFLWSKKKADVAVEK